MWSFLTSAPVLLGAAILGAGILVSCRSGAKREPLVLPIQTLTQGTLSGVSEASCVALRSDEELVALWARHGNLQLPLPQPPSIDFGASMVVAVFLGQRPSAGYGVEISQVDHVPGAGDEPASLMVRAVETGPAPGAAVAQVVTSPFHVVQVERAEGDPILELTR